ncbi:MAG: TrkH family potassium uptake protein [Desulfarculaceae bacterium]|nr:TrkH family potassium uptake protein [Desulfarculaceae bacterium]MCF8072522.1 TrkH family potassium uptake protein [Desulfarculaceae bacterium]MCF8103663.1 TrkH family potassium uptake protein [Desulfarculaceae bacterium]MCF8117063.1 TrkH family potassium uptake protein [Desulfarculaceae bacterium]
MPNWLTPSRLVPASFAAFIVLGAALLYLPVMQAPDGVSLLDCLFTATSAVCVTGLITVDTATAWSPWGQGLILMLLQAGGLGIMTFSVALLYLARRRPGPMAHLALKGALGPVPGGEMSRLVRDVLLYTFVLEGLGAAVLFMRFWGDFPASTAAAQAVFHAISAFCNAGFSLFSNSLVGYSGDPTVNLTVMILIVLGGLGFVVLRELTGRLRRKQEQPPRRMSLQVRLVLATSAVLIVGGAAALLVTEWLAQGPIWGEGVWPLIFQTVTPRTAGFNTVNLNTLSNGSLLIIMLLMFIGASPGSTGGGVKTTTIAVLFSLAVNRLKGRPGAQAWGRAVPERQVEMALLLALGTALVLVCAVVLLSAVGLADGGHVRRDFLHLAFEAVSALGTVGLSLGVTPELTPAGKGIIIVLMFVGRLGPLAFVYSLAQQLREPSYRLAEERVILG